jgi:hypothetical protein
MTHAGMSLVVEGVLFGRLLVMLPLFVDQGIITRLMAERRVGLEVPRDERNFSVGRYDVAATVMAAEEEGTGGAHAQRQGDARGPLGHDEAGAIR